MRCHYTSLHKRGWLDFSRTLPTIHKYLRRGQGNLYYSATSPLKSRIPEEVWLAQAHPTTDVGDLDMHVHTCLKSAIRCTCLVSSCCNLGIDLEGLLVKRLEGEAGEVAN